MVAPAKRPTEAWHTAGLVEGAVDYARSLGLEPHPDYRLGARVFGGIASEECTRTFVFGEQEGPSTPPPQA
jgi:hypothetical protein